MKKESIPILSQLVRTLEGDTKKSDLELFTKITGINLKN